MSPFPLVSDVLLNVFLHLPQSDVSQIMQTSKSFYAAGIKPLLRAGISIKDMRALVSFCRLILSDVPARAPHVRRLDLCILTELEGYGDDSECEAGSDEGDSGSASTGSRLLVQVLLGTTHLHELRIDNCEALLELETALPKAIQALPRLRCLHIHSIGETTLAMLCQLESSLTEIDIHCYNEEDDTGEMDDPLPLVRRHQATLERLSAWYVEIRNNTLQFSNVRALALRQARGLDISVLQHAFPNLTYLELSAVDDEESMDELREDNMARQRPESWRDLHYLCGSLDSLYGLGLLRPVKRVDVDGISTAEETLQRLRVLVNDTSPTHLLIRAYSTLAAGFDVAALPALLPTPGAPSVSHLTLDLCLLGLRGTGESLIVS